MFHNPTPPIRYLFAAVVFSQNDGDGILLEILRRINITTGAFLEL